MLNDELIQIIQEYSELSHSEQSKRGPLDLSRKNLSYTNLIGADFQDAKLEFTDFRGANLIDADFDGADLSYADLRGANLTGANLSGADLTSARFCGANLRGADLTDTILTEDTSFYAADLTEIDRQDLGGAHAKAAKFSPNHVEYIRRRRR